MNANSNYLYSSHCCIWQNHSPFKGSIPHRTAGERLHQNFYTWLCDLFEEDMIRTTFPLYISILMATLQNMQVGLKEEESTAMLYNRRSNFDIQLRMTMGLVVGSFIMMLKVLPCMEAAGRGDEKALVFFTITDTFALFAAMMVATTFLTGCHKSPKLEHLIRIILCCAALSFIYAVLSIAYMQLLPTTQWIVLCVGGVPATVLALLLLYHLLNTFPKQQKNGDFKLPM